MCQPDALVKCHNHCQFLVQDCANDMETTWPLSMIDSGLPLVAMVRITILLNRPKVARAQLIQDLLANPGYFEVDALVMLLGENAVVHLRAHLPASGGGTRIKIARALWDLAGDENAPAIIMAVMADPRMHWSTKIDTAMALSGINTVALNAYLKQALADEEYLVRYNVARSLATNYNYTIDDMGMVKIVGEFDPAQIAAYIARLEAKAAKKADKAGAD